jgi:hypothetical protein
MTKVATVSVLTANRLRDGRVVFLDFEGAWSERLGEAVVARFPDEVRALKDRGAYDAAHNIVVEAYLVEVRETAGGLLPVRYRERVRAAGPSVLGDVPGYREPALAARQADERAGEYFAPEPAEGGPTTGRLAIEHLGLGSAADARVRAA